METEYINCNELNQIIQIIYFISKNENIYMRYDIEKTYKHNYNNLDNFDFKVFPDYIQNQYIILKDIYINSLKKCLLNHYNNYENKKMQIYIQDLIEHEITNLAHKEYYIVFNRIVRFLEKIILSSKISYDINAIKFFLLHEFIESDFYNICAIIKNN